MSKRLVLLFCALFVFAAAVPAFAAVQNIKVGGDVIARYINRNNFDLSKDATDDADDVNVLNSVVRLRVDADLTDNVSAVIRLINERNWDEANVSTTDIDLDLAYITLKEFLYSPLTLTIGRQELHFGNDLIMGDGVGQLQAGQVNASGHIGTNQTTNYAEASGYGDIAATANNQVNGDLAYRKAFDAVRATLNYDPLVVDVVFAKLRENVVTRGMTNDDADLWGINAGYQMSDDWNTSAEAYVWSKIIRAPMTTIAPGAAALHTMGKTDTCYTIGGRVSTSPSQKLNIQQELAMQFGKKNLSWGGYADRDRKAMAAQTIITYVTGWNYQPVLGLIYTYLSGDADATSTDADKNYHGWDSMFENQTGGHIANALNGSTNCHAINMFGQIVPMEDITLRADYVNIMLAKAQANTTANGLTNDYGSYTLQANKKEFAQELDLKLLYDYTEDVQFGLLMGWFFPGRAFQRSDREMASECIATVKLAF